MELSTIAVKPLGAKGLIKTIRRIGGIAEEQHRFHATLKEPPGNSAQENATETLPLDALQQVDLVQFASIPGHTAIVGLPFRETDQLTSIVFHDAAEPAAVVHCEGFAPLPLPELERWASRPAATVGFVEGLDVQPRQRWNVRLARVSKLKRHNTGQTGQSVKTVSLRN